MTTWGIVIVVVLIVVVAAWLWLRSASPQPPGQHRGPRRARRRDPHDFPLTPDDEPPPEEGE